MPKHSTSWGDVAGWYDDLLGSPDSYQRTLILPNLLRLVAPKVGQRILDLACGQGFFAHAFADAGAKVVAVDVSEELVRIGRSRDAATRIAWHVAPSHKLPFLANGSVDAAAMILSIQNIDDARATFAECRRVLRPDGVLHLVLNHPAFRAPKRTSWGWDEKTKTQYRRIDAYLTETKKKIAMHPGSAPSVSTLSFHRPLQFYVKTLARTGFAVVNLEEWMSNKKSDSGSRAAAENKARNEIPLFMYIEAKAL